MMPPAGQCELTVGDLDCRSVSLCAVFGGQQTVFQILLACYGTDTIDVKMVVSYSCSDEHANSVRRSRDTCSIDGRSLRN